MDSIVPGISFSFKTSFYSIKKIGNVTIYELYVSSKQELIQVKFQLMEWQDDWKELDWQNQSPFNYILAMLYNEMISLYQESIEYLNQLKNMRFDEIDLFCAVSFKNKLKVIKQCIKNQYLTKNFKNKVIKEGWKSKIFKLE